MECEIIDLGVGTSKKTEVGGSVNDIGNRKNELMMNRNRELKVDSNSGKRVIRWERFLPKKVVRVLLVENDDSTRHIVSALLKKCNYHVVAVADGLKAWDILKEKHYNFDLVLTEVEMPSLSGTDLLSKIMSSDLYKNIPVIMTSSNDSISIVLKCMLIGAVDFLVKPVRKNELKNLWQHVWRKYRAVNPETGNSNGSGSANETSSNNGNSNAGSGNIFEISDSCDKGSDTRSSCSIAGIRTKSMQKQEGPGPPQIEYTNFLKETDLDLEKHGAYVAKGAAPSIYKKGKAKADKLAEIEIKLTLSIHKKTVSTDEIGEENVTNVEAPYREGGSVAPNLLDRHDRSSVPSEVIIGTEISDNCHFQGLDIDRPENHLHKSEKTSPKRNACDSGSLPSLELSLRSQLKSQNGNDFPENHVLKHSEASAFSRYGNARRRLSCPSSSSSSFCIRTNELCNSNGQISTTNDNSKNAPSSLIEISTTSQVNRGEDSVDCQYQPSSGNKEGACPSYVPSEENVCHPSTGKTPCHHLQYGVGPFPGPIGAIPFQNFWGNYGATFQPHLYPQPSAPLAGSTSLPKEFVVDSCRPSTENENQPNNVPQTVNHHPIYGNHNPPQFLHWMEQRTDVEYAPSRVLSMTPGEVYQSGNSNCGATIASERKGNNENMDAAANAGIALERVRGDGIQKCTVNWLDCDRSRREAALTKFRLKRKDRCFEKKVRYHNRKKLAEQRPRVKGQFVCQTVAEPTSLATESD